MSSLTEIESQLHIMLPIRPSNDITVCECTHVDLSHLHDIESWLFCLNYAVYCLTGTLMEGGFASFSPFILLQLETFVMLRL